MAIYDKRAIKYEIVDTAQSEIYRTLLKNLEESEDKYAAVYEAVKALLEIGIVDKQVMMPVYESKKDV